MNILSSPAGPRPSEPARAAFTLIEILVVVALVGILAVLLSTSVGNIRRQASSAKDLSNFRQIGSAIQLHVTDNDGQLPNPNVPIPGTELGGTGGNRWQFHEAVERYLGDYWLRNPVSIYTYLGNPIWYSSFAEPFPGFSPNVSASQVRPLAYGYNGYIVNSNWAGRTQVMPNLSRFVIMAEVNNRTNVSMTQPPETRSNVSTGYRVNRNGKALYLFGDGRVESLAGDHSEAALLAAKKTNIWRWW